MGATHKHSHYPASLVKTIQWQAHESGVHFMSVYLISPLTEQAKVQLFISFSPPLMCYFPVSIAQAIT